MNVDIRGVKRGACLDCECTEYMYITDEGTKCAYCFCAPTKHVKIEQSQRPTESFQTPVKASHGEILTKEISTNPGMGGSIEQAKSLTGCSLQGTSSKTGVYMVSTPPSSSMASGPPPSCMASGPSTSPASSLLTVTSLLPEKLPKAIEMAMKKRKLTQNQQNVVVRSIAERCYAVDAPNHVIDVVADLAVEKWSPLKSGCGLQQSKSLAIQIKRRVGKLNASENSEAVEDTAGEGEAEAHNLVIKMMREEMQKKNPCQTKLKNYLTSIRKDRMYVASQMCAATHLNTYSAFKNQDLLLWEFTQLINTSEEELLRNWNCCVDAMSRYLEDTVNAMPVECVSYDMKTVHILMLLPLLLKSGKRTKDRTKFVIEIFEEGTSLQSILPAADEPPRLVGIGSKKTSDLYLTCYVKGTPLFVSKAVKGLLLLIATYWIFDITFPCECRPSLLFVCKVLLKHEFKSKDLLRSGAVLRLLKQLKL